MKMLAVATIAALTFTAAAPALAAGDGSSRHNYLNGFRVLTPQELNSGQLFEGRNARVEREQERGSRSNGFSGGSVSIENILDPTTTARGEYVRGGGDR